MGAEVILNVVKTTTPDRAQEVVLAHANSIVNQTFTVSVNCAAPIGRGSSLMVDPEGVILAESSDAAPVVLVHSFDLDDVSRVREKGTAGTNRMWEQFPGLPAWVWIVGFVVITTLLNILGIKVADKANFLLMAFQVLVIGAFMALSIASIVASQGGIGLVDASPFANPTSTFAGITAGAAIAAYSFLGFGAVTTFTEETVDPRKTVPRAILLVALIGGAIFVLVSCTTQLVRPGGVFTDSSSAAFDIAMHIGGNLFGAIFLAGLVIAQFASGPAAQAAASRLLFAMGRDGVLPRRILGEVSKRFRSPVFNLVIIGVVGFIAIFLDVATSTSFINFGAFVAFTMVNVGVIFYFVRQRRQGNHLNPVFYFVLPLIGGSITL